METMVRIGVVGYSGQSFNKDAASHLLRAALSEVCRKMAGDDYALVSGLTNVGVPAIAYQIANERKYKTVGIACSKAVEYDCFPVDERIIVGDNWGDESSTFIDSIDCLVRVGGGAQSRDEVEKAKSQGLLVVEYGLEAIA